MSYGNLGGLRRAFLAPFTAGRDGDWRNWKEVEGGVNRPEGWLELSASSSWTFFLEVWPWRDNSDTGTTLICPVSFNAA